jgi:hypothetical protein
MFNFTAPSNSWRELMIWGTGPFAIDDKKNLLDALEAKDELPLHLTRKTATFC